MQQGIAWESGLSASPVGWLTSGLPRDQSLLPGEMHSAMKTTGKPELNCVHMNVSGQKH